MLGTPDHGANSIHMAADIASCFLIWGDVRDLMMQSYVFIQGEDVDGWMVGSSVAGLVLTIPYFIKAKLPMNIIKIVMKVARGTPMAKLGREVVARGTYLIVTNGPSAAYRYMRNTGIVYGVLLSIESGLPQSAVQTAINAIDDMFSDSDD